MCGKREYTLRRSFVRFIHSVLDTSGLKVGRQAQVIASSASIKDQLAPDNTVSISQLRHSKADWILTNVHGKSAGSTFLRAIVRIKLATKTLHKRQQSAETQIIYKNKVNIQATQEKDAGEDDLLSDFQRKMPHHMKRQTENDEVGECIGNRYTKLEFEVGNTSRLR